MEKFNFDGCQFALTLSSQYGEKDENGNFPKRPIQIFFMTGGNYNPESLYVSCETNIYDYMHNMGYKHPRETVTSKGVYTVWEKEN